MIYLDYNATAPLLPAVREAMVEAMARPLNPSSLHAEGRHGRMLVDRARRSIASAVSAFPQEVIFTSGGTEANALALLGLPGRRYVAATEHASLRAQPEATLLPVDGQGLVQLGEIADGALVSVQLANNETGVIQPIADIARHVHAKGGLLHVDASQALGKMPVDMGQLGADALTLCAHKFGGPQGIGALVLRQGLTLSPQLRGGAQEDRRRAGTENVAAIVGFAAAVETMPNLAPQAQWLAALVTRLRQTAPNLRVAGEEAPRLPNTLCLTMPGVSHETQVMHFDLAKIAVSAGAACSSGRVEASHVLLAMGWSVEEARTAIRLSTGWGTTEVELAAFAAAWELLYQRHQARAS